MNHLPESSKIPFVFQVAAALKGFAKAHPERNPIDLSIGTPPTSPGIRARQMRLLFGEADNSFVSGSFEAEVFDMLTSMVRRMGKYEAAGGEETLKNLAQGRATAISGGEQQALELWSNIRGRFPEYTLGKEIFVTATADMERCGLALFSGEEAAVQAMEELHTSLLGTPSSVQEDFFMMLSQPWFRDFLKGEMTIQKQSPGIGEMLALMAFIAHDPLPALLEKGEELKRRFSGQFARCLFGVKAGLLMAAGNGGGREALHHSETILLEEGITHMLLFQPHWTYSNVYTRLKLSEVPGRASGQPNFEALRQKLESLTEGGRLKNTAITLNSPNNPLGIVYSKETLQQLLALAKIYGVFLVDDACYLQILRKNESQRQSLLDVAYEVYPEALDQVLTAVTASKGLGMAGARIGGVLTTHPDFQARLEQLYSREFPNLLALFLAEKLTRDTELFHLLLDTINQEIDERVQAVTEVLDRRGIAYLRPAGAFYLEIHTPFLENRVDDMRRFALRMAREEGVAFMPMEVFGGPSFALRLSLGGEKSAGQLAQEMEIFLNKITA